MNMIKKIITSTIIFSVYGHAYGQSNVCQIKDKSLIAGLEKHITSCGFQAKMANFEGVKEDHRKKVYDKLAQKLALQINQNSEELGLLTSYFASNQQDLSMGSAEVKKNCSLSNIEEIQTCGGKKTGPHQALKLEMLKNKLKSSHADHQYGDDLSGIMAENFVRNLGLSNSKTQGRQCPLEGDSGSFILDSQIDEISAVEIIEAFSQSSEVSNPKFDRYAQLKLIKETNNPLFIEKFKNYLQNKPKNASAKEYISHFFSDSDHQKILAPALAIQCKNINGNINKFLCSDLDELGSLKSQTSTDLFGGLDIGKMEDQFAVDFSDQSVLTAYGFQCLAQKKKPLPSGHEQKLDDWYTSFTQNTRPVEINGAHKDVVKNFCDKYLCKSEEVKNTLVCKNGGPITGQGLKEIFNCDKFECKSDVLKSIDYITGLEKLQLAAGAMATSSSISSLPSEGGAQTAKLKISLPDFAENYLGVKKSLVALGMPVTPEKLAKKTQDFVERKLNPIAPSYTLPNPEPHFAENTAPKMELSPHRAQAPSKGSFSEWPEPIATKSKTVVSKNITADAELEIEELKNEIEAMKKKVDAPPSAASASTSAPINRLEAKKHNLAIENALDRSINSKETSLRERERLADERDANYWRRDEEQRQRAQEIAVQNSAPKAETARSIGHDNLTSSPLKDDNKKSVAKLKKDQAMAEVSASSSGLIVTPEKLDQLDKMDLKNYGVNIEEPFIISIRMNGKLIHVRVAKVAMQGKTFLAPRLNDDNAEVKAAVLKSPLFKEFRYFYEKEHSSFFPVK